jgi:hypothetical protein
VYWAAFVLRPLVEKFQGIFQTGDFLDEMVSVLHKDGVGKRSVAHQFLQENERLLVLSCWPEPMAAKASINMFSANWNVKIGDAC